jgi:uncharacterized OB-fold protein
VIVEGKFPMPIPTPTEDSQPFWDGCKRKELLLQKCRDCGHIWFPPSVVCPRCMSMSNEWIEASGKARVYSWTIFHQLYYPSFADQIPYNVAIVELEEGPRMHSNVVDCKNEDIHIDMPLELIWEQIDDSDWYLPKYKPATGG